MPVSLRITPAPHEPQKTEIAAPAALTLPAHAYLARLAALHDEAAETAHLANLLGRAPLAAGTLAVAALVTAAISASYSAPAPIAAWLLLCAMSIGAIVRAYARAIREPFDPAALKNFARSLSAILLYAGAAWGAGIFLALPAGSGFASCVVFAVGMSAALAGILRARDVTFCFLVPTTAVSAFCALMRDASAATAFDLLAGGVAVGVAAYAVERLAQPSLRAQTG